MATAEGRARKRIPSFEKALRELLGGDPSRAAALFAERALADPTDWISRSNRTIALYEAGRWKEADTGFKADIAREGIEALGSVPALFCIGYCRLQLEDPLGALSATAAFLNLSNEDHPFYSDGVENIACAWERLGHPEMAASLRDRGWSRDQVLQVSFRLLGITAKPRPPRDVDWYAEPDPRK